MTPTTGATPTGRPARKSPRRRGLLSACTLARAGAAFEFEDSEAQCASESRGSPGDEDLATRWVVHPYLFDCGHRDVETDRETAEAEWVHPTEILRRETVPKLWVSYSRVAPTMQQVAGDDEHGSAYVSVRALEVLRDRVGSFAVRDEGDDGSDWSSLTAVAERLLDARASMAAVANRVNRAMAKAAEGNTEAPAKTPEAVEQAARQGIERAVRADEAAAANAADEIRGATVLTLSGSGTVLEALPAPERVFVAESRPAREGVGVAERLAGESGADGPEVSLHTDAAIAHVLASEAVDAVLVGADGVLPDGRVVNKTGTRGAALAASREGVPVYAIAATDKIRTDDAVHLEDGNPEAVYDSRDGDSGGGGHGEADIGVLNPTFDVTPADLVTGIITECGVLDEEGISIVFGDLQLISIVIDKKQLGPVKLSIFFK
jgi:translation initiation factor 2B subunit (eIF-2B alpha/beta/delta family)